MNFRYLDDAESKNHRTSFRRNSKYICTDHLDKYLFSIADDIYNYPIICELIKNHKRYIRLKSTIYYICEQTGSTSTFVSGYGKVYSYQYKAILEITRNKCEDILENDITTTEVIGELFRKDIKDSLSEPISTIYQYNPTDSTASYIISNTNTSGSYLNYITSSNTSTSY